MLLINKYFGCFVLFFSLKKDRLNVQNNINFMRVLFICRANVARSQMAEEFFKDLFPNHIAFSAGLNPPVEWEGEKLIKTKYLADCMQEAGFDIRDKNVKRLTSEMVYEADKIVVLGERENWPSFLKAAKHKITYWDVKDPDEGEIELYRQVREEIRSLVRDSFR